MTDNLQSELAFSFLASNGLQWLKCQSWFPWVTGEEQNWNRLASAFIAFIGSAGIIFSATHTGIGAWAINITGLTWQNVAHVLGHGIRIYGEQKLWFHTVVRPSAIVQAGK